MWPRVVELLIAAWLAASPWLFGHGESSRTMWWSDAGAAAAIVILAGGSIARPAWRLHLGELLVAAWLVGFGYLAAPAPLTNLQNDILTGIVLAMFAIIPNPACQAPRAWREFARDKQNSAGSMANGRGGP